MPDNKKCPVCGMEITDGGVTANAGGRKVAACCDDCARKIEEDPAEYVGTKTAK